MKSCARTHPPHRLGMALALLALLAQFWLGQMSTAHLGRMLTAATAQASDICTAADSSSAGHGSALGAAPLQPPGTSPFTETPASTQAGLHCPVCAAAAASTLLGKHSAAGLVAFAPPSTAHFSYLPAPPKALRHTSLYPPAHAPPLA